MPPVELKRQGCIVAEILQEKAGDSGHRGQIWRESHPLTIIPGRGVSGLAFRMPIVDLRRIIEAAGTQNVSKEQIRPMAWTTENLLKSSYLKAADIQRDYQWLPQQVGELMQDLRDHMAYQTETRRRVPYFLGTMVGTGTPPRLAIYDGLQRTTTLVIIAAMLRDRVTDDRLKARLASCIEGPKGFRLTLPPPDDTMQRNIQPMGATLEGIRGGFGRRVSIRQNVNRILRHLEELSEAELNTLARLALEDVQIVFLLVDDAAMAKKVFETTNRRGLAIEAHDLIKSRLPEFARSEEDAADLVAKWEAIRQDISRDYKGFVEAIACYTLRRPPQIDHVEALVDWMAHRHGREGNGLHGWLGHIARLTRPWNQIEMVTRGAYAQRKVVSPLLPLWPLDWTDWHPLALKLFDMAEGGRKGEEWLASKLDLLQRRTMALHLSRATQSNRRYLYREAIKELDDGDDPFLQGGCLEITEPQRRRIRTTLRRPIGDAMMRRIILKWFEAQGAEGNLAFMYGDRDSRDHKNDPAEVEHILPQNVVKGSAWREAFPSFDDRSRLPDLIGNLVLMPASINRELDDGSFKAKRDLLKKRKKRLAPFSLALEVAALKAWTPEVIEARTSDVGERIWKELRLPDDPEFLVADEDFDLEEEGEAVDDEVLGSDTGDGADDEDDVFSK
jgi:hypothetical protein